MFNRKKVAELERQLSELKMMNGLLTEENTRLFRENREVKGKLKIHEVKATTWTSVTYSEVSRCIYKKGGEVVIHDIGKEAATMMIDLLWKEAESLKSKYQTIETGKSCCCRREK